MDTDNIYCNSICNNSTMKHSILLINVVTQLEKKPNTSLWRFVPVPDRMYPGFFFWWGGEKSIKQAIKQTIRILELTQFIHFAVLLCFFWATVQALEAVVTRWGTWNFAKVQAEFDQAKGPQHRSVAPGRSKFYGPCCGDFLRLVWFVEVHRHIGSMWDQWSILLVEVKNLGP